MCQLGCATALRYLVRRSSGCFCVGASVDEKNSYMGGLGAKQITFPKVGCPHPISEGTNRIKTVLPTKQESILPAGPLDFNCNVCRALGLELLSPRILLPHSPPL